MDGLAGFDPLVAAWFRENLGEPSGVQAEAWKRLRAGEHVLALAPTGSGKTLAAFLVALDSYFTGAYPLGRLGVLYVSPLKALNSDIRRNLLAPAAGLRAAFLAAGRAAPGIRVMTRSGDTSPAERRSFLKDPPEILATTPESFALLLNSPKARDLLRSVRLVVVDEVHALLPTKRGAFLSVQLERLAQLAGEFQRAALSATVADIADAARFVGGAATGPGGERVARSVSVVNPRSSKALSVLVRYPPAPPGRPLPGPAGAADQKAASAAEPALRWPVLIERFKEAAARNRTTLVFVNSRRHAEKAAFLMNEDGPELAWAHHGSLSRELRSSVEERLKAGSLPAVIATGSLELGIDIGSVDEVLLAGTPLSVSVALQRAGRSGHRLGAESRAVLYPLHGWDLLLAAALAPAAQRGELEAVRRPRNCLDVLSQAVLACAAMDDWTEDALYALLRRSAAFWDLEREDYDAVVALLRGRWDAGRLPSLRPRLDRLAGPGVLRAKGGALPLLYSSGGVIPDRGSFRLNLAGGGAPLGELDEEFVWERRLGDTFSLGTRAWRIVGIDERSVSVVPTDKALNIVPFWRAEGLRRGEDAMLGVLDLLDSSIGQDEASLAESLRAGGNLDEEAAEALASFIVLQRDGAGLPGRRRAVLESFRGPDGQGRYAFLHNARGGRTNAALGIALRAVSDESLGPGALEFFWDDAGILVSYSRDDDEAEADIPGLFTALASRGVRAALRSSLESSGLFGAAFREAAGRALLLDRGGFGKRTALWLTRLRAKRLYEEVRSFPDFPLVKEAWRVCLEDELDPSGAQRFAEQLASGAIVLESAERSFPSPFARGSVWQASDSFMYRRDDGLSPSAADGDLLGGLLAEAGEGPLAEASVAGLLAARSSRRDRDYAPRDAGELADWLDERRALAASDWAAFGAALAESGGADPVPGAASARPVFHRFPGASEDAVLSPDLGDGSGAGFVESDLEALVLHWLRYEGPVEAEAVEALFGSGAADALEALLESGAVLRVRLGGEGFAETCPYCEAEFAARLFRASRAERRRRGAPAAEAPLAALQAEAARRQRVLGAGPARPAPPEGAPFDAEAAVDALKDALEPLLGRGLPQALWEREVLPARLDYRPYCLELLCARTGLVWYGAGEDRTGFSLPEDLSLSDRPGIVPEEGSPEARLLEALREDRDAGLGEAERGAAQAALVRSGLATSPRFDAFRELEKAAAPRPVPPKAVSAADGPVPAAADGRPFGAYRPKGAFPTRSRWERSRSRDASWLPLSAAAPPADAAEAASRLRGRARQLLSRWGLVSRSVAALEEGSPPWPELFRVLRLMELSGEILGGRFLSGLDELQFALPDAAFLAGPAPEAEDGLYCLAARDPASLAGLSPLARELDLPPRAAGAHLVWKGPRLVLSSRSQGRELRFRSGDDPERREALALLCRRLCRRAVEPLPSLLVESVDGLSASASPLAPLFLEAGFVRSLKGFEYFSPR